MFTVLDKIYSYKQRIKGQVLNSDLDLTHSKLSLKSVCQIMHLMAFRQTSIGFKSEILDKTHVWHRDCFTQQKPVKI